MYEIVTIERFYYIEIWIKLYFCLIISGAVIIHIGSHSIGIIIVMKSVVMKHCFCHSSTYTKYLICFIHLCFSLSTLETKI